MLALALALALAYLMAAWIAAHPEGT